MVRKVTRYCIIELFLGDYNKRFYLRELALLLNKPHQTIKPYVKELVKENILIENRRKNIVEYSLNLKNKKIIDYLVISEKERLIEKLNGAVLLNVLHEKLSNYFLENSFIVFGSSVNEIRKNSDIDLLVIGKKNISKEIKSFEEVYNKKIHKIQITDLKKVSHSLIKEIYKKHLILNNTEEVINFFWRLNGENKLV